MIEPRMDGVLSVQEEAENEELLNALTIYIDYPIARKKIARTLASSKFARAGLVPSDFEMPPAPMPELPPQQ